MIYLFLLLWQTNSHYTTVNQPEVYICRSQDAYRYHSRWDCPGFRHCMHRESYVDSIAARKDGYTRCTICWK